MRIQEKKGHRQIYEIDIYIQKNAAHSSFKLLEVQLSGDNNNYNNKSSNNKNNDNHETMMLIVIVKSYHGVQRNRVYFKIATYNNGGFMQYLSLRLVFTLKLVTHTCIYTYFVVRRTETPKCSLYTVIQPY